MTTGIPADAATEVGEGVPAGSRRALARSAALLSAAWILANAANYLLAVVGSRKLGPTGYGVLGPLLGVLAVVSVPGLALQMFVARRAARNEIDARAALRTGLLLGGVGAVVGAVLIPALAHLLHLSDALGGLAATLLLVLPVAVVSAVQGWLQGRERFGLLAILVIAAGAARLVGGVIPLAAGASGATAMIGVCLVMTALAVVVSVTTLRRSPPAGTAMAVRRWSDLTAAVLGLGGLLVLANLDVLIARQLLPAAASGRYAAAAVISRVALWLPQAVSLAVLPRLTHTSTRLAALRDAVVATVAVGALSVAVTAAAGGLLVRIAFGSAYGSLAGVAWQFALQGGALAVVQLLVIDDIARASRGLLPLLAAAAVIETVILELARPATIGGVISVAMVVAVGAAALAGLRLVLEGRSARAQ